jgi:hypothetical protein
MEEAFNKIDRAIDMWYACTMIILLIGCSLSFYIFYKIEEYFQK